MIDKNCIHNHSGNAKECFKYIIDGQKVLIKMLETFDECCYKRK